MTNKSKMSTKTLVMGAVLTALVVILQYLGSFVKFGPFSISLVLIPIVIGTATCGKGIGAWLGFVFGVVVLAFGDAAPFLAFNAWGTIITVLAKGTLCGYIAGLVYETVMKLAKGEAYFSAVASAIICPIVNTGVFVIGCFLFFMPVISQWAGGGNAIAYIFASMIGINFLIELGVNIVFSPIIVRILKATGR